MIEALRKRCALAAIFLLFLGAPLMSDAYQPLLSQPARGGARPRAFTFVQLVFEAKAIAVGTVTATSPGGAPPIALAVENAFPADLPDRLQVTSSAPAAKYPIAFSGREQVVLFLAEVDRNQAVLLGTSDVGKWPRRQPDWLFTVGHVRPLPEVVAAIELLLKTDAAKTCEQRLSILLRELLPSGSLGQIAAAQYAADYTRWEEVQSSAEVGLPQVRWLMAAHLMPEAERRDPAVIYALLQLLSSAPSTIAVPYLIAHLDAADAAERDTAFSSLQTVTRPYTQETFDYVSASPADRRNAAISRWQQWWSAQRPARLRDEVPRMLSDLESTSPLRRAAGNLALRLVSGRDAGFHSGDPPEQRKQAIGRWQLWWAGFSQNLP